MSKKSFQKLDDTLKFLLESSDAFGLESSDVHNELDIANNSLEQHMILEKLRKDGNVEAIYPKDSKTGKEDIYNPSFVASFAGKMYLESGGYKVEYVLRRRELLNRKVLSILNPGWKILGFVVALMLTVKLFNELFIA